MSVQQPSQYEVDNMEQGDIIYIVKRSLLYRFIRHIFLNKPKIKIKNSNVIKEHYQEDCVLIYGYELNCMQLYTNTVPVIIGYNNYNLKILRLKEMQVGLHNIVLKFFNNMTITIPLSYIDNAIEKNKIALKKYHNNQAVRDAIKFQRYKGDYFKRYVKDNNITNWTAAYCSVCGKSIDFEFKDNIIIHNNCDCGDIIINKPEFSYDEFSLWFYNQTNPNLKNRFEKFWFDRG